MSCGGVERHRLTWLFLKRETDLFEGSGKQMLHVAPEPIFERLLNERIGSGYLTADLFDRRAMVKMDITDIQYPNETFDVIYCSHVLEHVQEDLKAMSEFVRVLKSDGWAVLIVPITAESTYEDPAITDPNERLLHFGQSDHVRKYGPDIVTRLKKAGFCVKSSKPRDFLTNDEIFKMGIDDKEVIYYCTK